MFVKSLTFYRTTKQLKNYYNILNRHNIILTDSFQWEDGEALHIWSQIALVWLYIRLCSVDYSRNNLKKIQFSACEDGKYGVGCVMSCGQCSDGLPCNKSSGVCETGCQSGWEGRYCTQKQPAGKWKTNLVYHIKVFLDFETCCETIHAACLVLIFYFLSLWTIMKNTWRYGKKSSVLGKGAKLQNDAWNHSL